MVLRSLMRIRAILMMGELTDIMFCSGKITVGPLSRLVPLHAGGYQQTVCYFLTGV
jgi:hypothetical protein